jgi:hypothetical protein
MGSGAGNRPGCGGGRPRKVMEFGKIRTPAQRAQRARSRMSRQREVRDLRELVAIEPEHVDLNPVLTGRWPGDRHGYSQAIKTLSLNRRTAEERSIGE